MRYRHLAVIASFSLLSACGSDSTTNPIDVATSGSLSFSYTGAGGGTFSATGGVSSATLNSTPYTTTWAAGYKDATDNSTNIAANIPRSATTSDLAVITVKGQSAQTSTISSDCTGSSTTACTTVNLLLGQSSSGQSFSNLCTLTTGSVTISSISSTNVTGTFSGSGQCFTSTGSTSAWAVTNGSFNVPLLTNVPSNLP